MENLEQNEWIERYLDGTLTPAEREALEARLSTDEAFRADFELHQQLHAEFADPKKLQLRDMLGDILQNEPVPSDAPRPNWLKISGIALLVLFGIWGVWQIVSPTQQDTPASPVQQVEQVPQNQPIAETDSPSAPPAQAPRGPIAMADKAAFKSNPTFEARMGNGGIRSTDADLVQMQSPSQGADFSAKNGMASIRFKGDVVADNDPSENPIQINIYASQSADSPIAQINPEISNRDEKAEKWSFSSKQLLRLSPGLYYYTLERQADSELIFVGKFTVDKIISGQ